MRKSMMAGIAVAVLTAFFVLQFYFVRELVAAKLLFGVAFAILLALSGLAYLLGSVGKRGLELAESGVRMIGDSARRGFSNLEGVSRKPPASERRADLLMREDLHQELHGAFYQDARPLNPPKSSMLPAEIPSH